MVQKVVNANLKRLKQHHTVPRFFTLSQPIHIYIYIQIIRYAHTWHAYMHTGIHMCTHYFLLSVCLCMYNYIAGVELRESGLPAHWV